MMKCYGVKFESRSADGKLAAGLNDMSLLYAKDGVDVIADLGSLLKEMAEDIRQLQGEQPKPDLGAVTKQLIDNLNEYNSGYLIHSSATIVDGYKITVERA